MTALKYDLVVEQGADYARAIPVLGLGQGEILSGWSVAGQARAGHESSTVLAVLDLAVSGTDVILRIPAAMSSSWNWRSARYDIEITSPGGSVARLLEGSIVVRPEITR